MKELTNFSVYSEDTGRFNNDWQAALDYTQKHGLNGLELLLNYDPPPETPPGLVQAVHLPFWITWLDVWRGVPNAAERYFPNLDPRWLQYFCGGTSPEACLETMRQALKSATRYNPAYGVFHVSHVEAEHAFTRKFTYSDAGVVIAAADLLNTVAATFEGGEPPVRLALENLWWPGLTFTANSVVETLAARLNFSNWCFVLDTGHLMNTNPTLETEEQAVDFVLQTVANLSPEIRERIETIHLNLSLSGQYQQKQIRAGLPAGFHQWDSMKKLEQSRLNALSIDQHRPFTTPRCREIIEAIQPQVVTHEFLSANLAELTSKLQTQRKALI